MKLKNLRHLVLVLGLFFSTSCGDDFLEPDLKLAFDEDNFFSSENQVFQGLIAAYDPLQWSFLDGRWTSSIMLGDIRSDNATAGGDNTNSDQQGWQQMDDFLEDEFLIEAETFWKKYYSGIRRTNLLISKGDLGTDVTDQYIAEAKFLRAFYHFELFRTYGPIPVITEPIEPNSYAQSRNTMSEVFSQIIQDLKDAIPLLPQKSAYDAQFAGRATSGAANGLLGKVYLYYADLSDDNVQLFDSASTYLNSVITSGEYQLLDDYNDLWAFGAANHSESVFEIQHSSDVPGDFGTPGEFLAGNAMVQLCGIRGLSNHPDYDEGWGFMLPTTSLYDAFLPADTYRRAATIVTESELTGVGASVDVTASNPIDFQGYWQQKFANWNSYEATNGGEINLLKDANHPYMRYADVLLMYAEALIRGTGNLADADAAVDLVRERGDGPDDVGVFTTAAELRTSQGWTALEVIQYERRIELALEGDRWFDLVRSGRLSSTLWDGSDLRSGNFDQVTSMFLPIPQREIVATQGALTIYPDAALFD